MRFRTAFVTAAIAFTFAAPALAANLASAPAPVVAQLAVMDAADCKTSKAADWPAYEKTLAAEYVEVDADGSKTAKLALVAALTQASPDRVTSCASKVPAVLTDGTKYFVFGTYTESGTKGAKKTPYRSVERFRDTWKRAGGVWLQIESLAYEMTLTNLATGKIVAHQVLPATAKTPPGAP